MKDIKFLLACLLLVSPLSDICGETVTKVITDENRVGLPYSVVMIRNRRGAVMSDEEGKVEMTLKSVSESDTVLVLYTGFEPMKISVVDFVSTSTDTISLVPSSRSLPEVVALPKKLKIKTVGKQYPGGIMKSYYGGKIVKGDAFGYEYHAKGDKRYALYKVGFYYMDDTKDYMTKMKFMVNVYDMSSVKSEPTNDFVSVLGEPLIIDYKYNPADQGKFVYTIPENIVLPKDAMVEIVFLDNLKDEELLWYKCNLLGKQNWTRTFGAGYDYWIKQPFAMPFFVECVEVADE